MIVSKINKEILEVGSSAITSVEYNYIDKILSIIFISGAKYEYNKVDTEIYLSMKYSESIGSFFNKHIKNKYDFKMV